MEPLFWGSLFLILYTYIGYPLILWLLPVEKSEKIADSQQLNASVVVAVCNEEKNILARIDNLLTQLYPADRLEIIIVSDGSTDQTCPLVKSVTDPRVHLFCLEKTGKAAALNHALSVATGQIVVFADARQRFAADAISRLVEVFADPKVGCVSGELLFAGDDAETAVGVGAYWTYEKLIRKLESRSGSTVGATGAVYAIRRHLYRPLPAGTILDDVLTPLNIFRQGFRTVFCGAAQAFDQFSRDYNHEWQRKVRTLAGNWQLLCIDPTLLLPWSNRLWWRFLSHKIVRLLVPAALPITFISAILTGGSYRSFAALQGLFYLCALCGALVPTLRQNRVIAVCYSFCLLNAAAAAGFWIWLTGQSQQSWRTVKSLT